MLLVSAANAQESRPLAPGVLKTIPGDLDPRDSYSLPMPLPKLEAADYDPVFVPKKDTLYGQSRRVIMFRDVWEYEFSFLGLRQAELLVPNEETGLAERQNVWYLIYRIRNLGKTLTYEQVKQSPDFDHITFAAISRYQTRQSSSCRVSRWKAGFQIPAVAIKKLFITIGLAPWCCGRFNVEKTQP